MIEDDITFAQAVKKAQDTIDSGKALEQLNTFIELSNKY